MELIFVQKPSIDDLFFITILHWTIKIGCLFSQLKICVSITSRLFIEMKRANKIKNIFSFSLFTIIAIENRTASHLMTNGPHSVY